MRMGVDLGGSKIEIIALGDDGDVLLRERVATPQGDYMATVMAVAGLVDAAEKSRRRRYGVRVGIGIPGAESRVSGLIKNANSTCLIGKPLKRDLEAALGREVRLANDANCFALSEAVDGAGAGMQTVFGVILGTGVGGGIVIDGKVLTGANAIAGEWGHNPMPGEHHKATPATAGARAASSCTFPVPPSPAIIAAQLSKLAGADFPQLKSQDMRANGDTQCEATLQRYEARLARALAQVINILDPDAIVLGGGLSNMERLYENVPRLWGEHTSFPTGWRQDCSSTATAIRPACAARPGYGTDRTGHRRRPVRRPRRLAAGRKPRQRDRQGGAGGRCACIEIDGLAGDEHADPRAHGGPKRPCTCFPQEHHAALAARLSRRAPPGSRRPRREPVDRGITEDTACIGDVFALGTVRLQIAQPRTPCWKIDARCGVEGVAAHVAEHGIAGWYFRVLQPGECVAGDA
jgi:fructokinase